MKVELPHLSAGSQYSFLYSLDSLRGLEMDTRVDVSVRQGGEVLLQKTLHAGDADLYSQFRVPRDGAAIVEVKAIGASGAYRMQVNRWPLSAEVKSAPGHHWEDALSLTLGRTMFAYGDDAEYIPLPGTSRKALLDDAVNTDWYKFDFDGVSLKLVFFQIELMERDQVPVNVSALSHQADGKPVAYLAGEDPGDSAA